MINKGTYLYKIEKAILRWFGHRKFIRFGIRDRIIRYFHNPDIKDDTEFVVPFFGATYRGKFNTFIDWSVFYYGGYGEGELMVIKDFLGGVNDPVFLDVGANVGHHTLFAAGFCKEVIAVEPFEPVYLKLKEKINDNALTNVRVLNSALGEHSGLSVYFPPATSNTGTGTFVKRGTQAESIMLPMTSGDELLELGELPFLDLIKIDTEGYEYAVLKGMKKVLNSQRPIVLFEWDRGYIAKDINFERSNVFPAAYLFFQLYNHSTILKIFQNSKYYLKEAKEEFDNGMILAIPQEKLNTPPLEKLRNRIKN